LELTSENYFSVEANKKYMSVSQFKAFEKCEFAALEEVEGRRTRAESTALLVGSYVDAAIEGTVDLFIHNHPEIIKKDGTLKADYVQAEAIVQRLHSDPMMMRYLNGEKQVIMTGEVEGVPVKIKMDSFHQNIAIVDLKVMKDFNPIYVPGEGRLNFIEAWRYDLQGAVYREIVKQNTGKTLRFFIAGITKESTPDIGLFEVPSEVLDVQLDIFKASINRYDLIKQHEFDPLRCEHCAACRDTKVLNKVTTWEELNGYGI